MGIRTTSPDAEALDDAFADNLRAMRTERGMTRRELSAETGIPYHSIEKIETGAGCRERMRRRVSIGEAVLLAEALGVKPGELLKGARFAGAVSR
jgi:transcriptional regulator with XRE-family HTH domain